ncbi:MAG TPA: BON domain-containing protein [Pseudomonadota bacterium]|nr:BON domain-containing protein [Pseudomonadota bacterium]
MAQRQSPQGHHEGRGSSRQGPQSRASEYRGQPSRERGQHHEESYEFGNREGEDISSSNAWYSGYRGSEDRDYSESAQGYSGPHRELQRSYGGQHRDNTQGGYGAQRRDQSAQGQSRFGSQDSSSNFYGPPGGPGYGGYGPQGSYGHGPSHREYAGPGSQSGYAGSQRDFADWNQRSGWNPGGFSQERGPGGAEPGSAHKRSRGPKGYKRSDERIREDVCERLGSQGEVDASEVEVQVQDGQVTLTGTVTHQRDKRHLEDLAEAVAGVQEVITQLRVHRADQQRGSSGATASPADKSSATDQRQRSESAESQGAPAPTGRPAPKVSGKRASA